MTSKRTSQKAVCRSVFLTIRKCILSAELTKTHSFSFFAHWVKGLNIRSRLSHINDFVNINFRESMLFESFVNIEGSYLFSR